MSKRSRIIVLCAVILALLVMATAVIQIISSKDEELSNTVKFVYLGSIILIGALSVVVVYFTKIRKSRYEKMLEGEYFTAYEIIIDGIGNSQLPASSKKDIKQDVLDLLLTAQRSGKPLSEAISDPQKFVQDIIRSFSSPGRFVFLGIFDGLIAFGLFILAITGIIWLEDTAVSFFNVGIDTAMVIFIGILSFFILPVTKRQTATKNPWMFFIPLGYGILFVAVSIFLRRLFPDSDITVKLLDTAVRMIPNMFILFIYAVLIPMLFSFKIWLRKYFISSNCP